MATQVYSTLFGRQSVAAAGPTNLYFVPAGKVAILRDVDVRATAASAGLVIGEGFATVYFWFSGTFAGQGSSSFRGRQVFTAGQAIQVFKFDAVAFDVSASGYLLNA